MLLALGTWGDAAGFWTSKPYLTNVVSALTGAAFGVPLALVVLQRIAASEADSREARVTRRLAARVSEDFAKSVEALAPAAQTHWALLQQMEGLLKESKDLYPAFDPPPASDQAERIAAGAIAILDGFLASSAERPMRIADMSTNWSFLSTEVRARLLETGSEWLEAVRAQELEMLMQRVKNALERWEAGTVVEPSSMRPRACLTWRALLPWLADGSTIMSDLNCLASRSSEAAFLLSARASY